MPVVPEKHLLSQIGHALSAQVIRGHEETSPSSLGAKSRRLPGEPSPLPQKLPSGISRTEQLLGLQRYMNFPFVPAYNGKDGGVVLDRVVHTLGSRGSSWWATITARLRAQRAWLQQKAGRSRKNSLLDPTNYALSVQTNSRVCNSLSVCANLDFDDFNQVVSLANGKESEVPLRMQAELKQKLPCHQLTAEAVLHGRYRGANNDGTVQVPRVLSADLASDSRKSGLRYQAGVFQIVSNSDAKDIFGSDMSELHTSNFLQCAATIEKDFVLWKGKRGTDKRRRGRPLSPFELAYTTSSKFSNELTRRLRKQEQPTKKAATPPQRKRMPFSALLHTPYLSFGGVAGILAQAKLDSLGGVPGREGGAGEGADAQGTSASPNRMAAAGRVASTLAHLSDGEFWTTRRLFGSMGLNMQFGNFSKHILDFTSISVKLDTGIPFTSSLSPSLGAEDLEKENGTANPEPGNLGFSHGLLDQYSQRKHMLSASLAQQVFGPIRIRADARCEIELHKPTQGEPLLNQLHSIVRLPAGVPRPEVIYGMDCQLPYMGGAARFSLWYSPTQREGLGEIRLL